jgi:hypothetical protein
MRHAAGKSTSGKPLFGAIDTYLHGKRRPIANTPPADQAGSSRAQLQALLDHVRRAQRPSGLLEGDEKARIAEARRRDKALLTDWVRNDVLLPPKPDEEKNYPMGGRFLEITVVRIIRVPGGREMICETNSYCALHFPKARR